MKMRSGLKTLLDRFYREYDFTRRLSLDPIAFPHRFSRPCDQEVSGFIASCFAYGKVGLFTPVLETLFSKMGESPYDFLLHFDPKKMRQVLGGLKYRFNESDDILCLLSSLQKMLRKHSSLEKAFKRHYRPSDGNLAAALTGFIEDLLAIDTSGIYGTDIRPRGYLHFLPSPAGGSACKRANLFLRWMVRDRDIDLGIWKGVPPSKLVIPLDVHIGRISKCLGLTSRSAQDWNTAVEITASLRELDPRDPLRYDFALCHHGISGVCRGRSGEGCPSCLLSGSSVRSRRTNKVK